VIMNVLLDDYGRVVVVGDTPPMLVGAPPPGPIVPVLPAGHMPRASGWPPLLHRLLAAAPDCVGCGRRAVTGHHVVPFHENPTLELDPANIALVCLPCHFVLCHGGDWRLTIPPDETRRRLADNTTTVAAAIQALRG